MTVPGAPSRYAGAKLKATLGSAAGPRNAAWASCDSAKPVGTAAPRVACSLAAEKDDFKGAGALRRESSSLPSPTNIFRNEFAGSCHDPNRLSNVGGVHASNLPLHQATMRRESSELAVPTNIFGAPAHNVCP